MKLPEGYINGVAPKKATAMGGFGQSVLEKLGWQKGEGLGKNKQGIDVPVSVTKKGDNVGLGGKRGWDSQQDFAIQAYETAMAKVTAQASEDDSSSDSSDEESDFSAAICNETSATAEELKLSRQLAKGNNLGRFGARAGKLQRIQEQEQAAVLGMVNATASGSCQAPQSKADMQKAPGSTAPASEVVPRAKIITVGALEEAAEPLPPPEPKPDTWWGHKVFASSGWLEGLNQNKRKARDAFTHDTQAAIYNSAMSKKIQGKTGMGKRKGRDAAADWVGKKTVFSEQPDSAVAPCAPEDEARADANCEVAGGSGAVKQSAAFLKTVRKLLRNSKKGKLKRSRLEATLCETLELSQQVVAKRLQKRIDANKLVQTQKWVMVN